MSVMLENYQLSNIQKSRLGQHFLLVKEMEV